MENVKSLFSSKTFWLAALQAIVGVVVVFQGAYPDVGALVIMKSVLDILVRINTVKAVTL